MSEQLAPIEKMSDREIEKQFDKFTENILATYGSLAPEEKELLEHAAHRKPAGTQDQGRQDEND